MWQKRNVKTKHKKSKKKISSSCSEHFASSRVSVLKDEECIPDELL